MTDDPFDDGKQLAFGVGMRGSTEKLAIQVADMSLSRLPIESVDFLCAGVPKQKRGIVGSHAESVSTQFVPFKQFFQESSGVNPAVYLFRPGNRVRDVRSFEQMRQHILLLYQGVEVSHSFTRDSDYFDCVAIEQQPSVRVLHLKEVAAPLPMASISRFDHYHWKDWRLPSSIRR
jgi:hypothetical protein